MARMRFRHGLLAWVMVVSIVLAGCSSSATRKKNIFPSAFASAPCPFTVDRSLTEGRDVRCGYLTVPANRMRPADGMLQLAVAIFKSASATPAPDPVIYLNGGPGGALLVSLAPYLTAQSVPYLLGNHDLILVDQRGVGYSRPSLDCPEVNNATDSVLGQNIPPTKLAALMQTALLACHTRLVASGLHLEDFTTLSDAADIHDLISALGYSQVDLNGSSYGTRLALAMLRSFPAHIRSVVLDASYPPQVNLLTNLPADAMRAFNVLFRHCDQHAHCHQTYPQLESLLYATVAKLNAHPLTLHAQDPTTNLSYTVALNGTRLVTLVFHALYATALLAQIPQMIAHVSLGNVTLATSFFNQLEFDDFTSRGMYYSVECSEDSPFTTAAQIAAAQQAFTPPIRAADLFNLQTRQNVCQFWHVPTVDAAQKAPVSSTIPTLILQGDFDPVSPPTNGLLTAKTLPNSTTLVLPGIGHGAFFTQYCPTSLVLAFFDAPTQQLDTTCTQSMSEPDFT